MDRELVLAMAVLGLGSITPASAAPISATLKKADTREFPGLPIGTFVALPQVVLSATRDDNIYAQRTDETEDTIFTLEIHH